jgi:hypothetical protein
MCKRLSLLTAQSNHRIASLGKNLGDAFYQGTILAMLFAAEFLPGHKVFM